MQSPSKIVLLVVAVVALVVGVLGLMDLKNVPFNGYFTGPDNAVTRVFPGSPAEWAGLQVGDVIESIGGVSVQDTKALIRQPRAEIGETRTIVIRRGGERREVELTYSDQPGLARALAFAGAFIGLCFLALPLWAYLKNPSGKTLILALFGLCFGIAFLPGPYSESVFLRTVGSAFATTVVVLGFAFLVHFLMTYPKRRPFMAKPIAKMIVYVPAILLAVVFLYLNTVQPDATPTFNQIIGVLVGLFIVGFFGWALVAMILNFARATAAERGEYGLGMMLLGTVVGLIPITLSSLIGAVAPAVQANLPGVLFYFLTMALIPITLGLAAARAPQAGD